MDEDTSSNEHWPTTLEEAVERIVAEMPEESKQLLRSIAKAEVIRFHHGWGTGIRNQFGLWRGNEALLESCDQMEPDGASGVIMEAVWQRVHDEG